MDSALIYGWKWYIQKINLSQTMLIYTHSLDIKFMITCLKETLYDNRTQLVHEEIQIHLKVTLEIYLPYIQKRTGEIGMGLLFRKNAVINRIISFQFKFIQDMLCSPQIRRVAFNVIGHVNLKIQVTILAKCPINYEF